MQSFPPQEPSPRGEAGFFATSVAVSAGKLPVCSAAWSAGEVMKADGVVSTDIYGLKPEGTDAIL